MPFPVHSFLLYSCMLDPFCNYSSSSTAHILIINSTLYTSKRCRFPSSIYHLSLLHSRTRNCTYPALHCAHPFTQEPEAHFIYTAMPQFNYPGECQCACGKLVLLHPKPSSKPTVEMIWAWTEHHLADNDPSHSIGGHHMED